MKAIKQLLRLISEITVLACLLAGCTKEPLDAAVESIELIESNIELHIGESKTLNVKFSPANATDKTIVWSSSDQSVATVSNGVVIAKNAGSTKIIAISGDKAATCNITVVANEVTGITLNQESVSLQVNEYVTISATVYPENATDKSIEWSSSDEDIATVSKGVIIAQKIGSATITAKSGDRFAICAVTVTGPPVSDIVLNQTKASLNVGDTLILEATINPSDASYNNISWTSSDDNVAKVSQGIVTAVQLGTATITATAGDRTASCTVTVGNYIVFKDTLVKQVCIEQFDKDDDGEISLEEASAVTDLKGLFSERNIYETITAFDELQYFDHVTELPDQLFADCTALQSVSIPSSVQRIGERCFSGCRSLLNVNIPSSVTELADFCFQYCESLSTIEIPLSITKIGEGILYACSNLERIDGKFGVDNGRALVIDGIMKAFAPYGLEEYTIPSSVRAVGSYCFSGCSLLTSIKIPSSVTTLDDDCFISCKSLSHIEIPSSVTALGYRCFTSCTSLSSIKIPSSVVLLGYGCFSGCTSLSSIEIPSSVTAIGYGCFNRCTSLSSIEIPSSVTAIEGSCFSGCTSLSSIEIPSSVTALGDECFRYCKSLSSIELPSSLTAIGSYCFFGCDSLVEIRCHATSVPLLGEQVFAFHREKGYLYVPEESICLYANDKYWSYWGYILKLE